MGVLADSDFNFDFNVSLTEEQRRGVVDYNFTTQDMTPVLEAGGGFVAEIAAMVGADVATYTREAPG